MREENGVVKQPLNIFLYAQEGFGKSSFGDGSTKPLFIGNECPPTISSRKLITENFLDFIDTLSDIANTDKYKEHKTIVIDTIDGVLKQAEDLILKGTGKNMNTVLGGYGAGWRQIEEYAKQILTHLQTIQSKGNNVIILSHRSTESFEDKTTGETYKRYVPDLNKNSRDLFMKSSQIIIYGEDDRIVKETSKSGKTALEDVKSKTFYFRGNSVYIAKTWFNTLPDELEYKEKKGESWREIGKLVNKYYQGAKSE